MVSRQYLRLIEGRLLGAWWALRPGVGGAALGAPLRPCSGLRRGPRLRPAGPCSPLRGLRSGLGGMRRGPVVPPIRAGRPALFAGPSGPWRGLRAPGALLGPLRLSRPRAARRGVRSAPCGGRRGLVLPPRFAPGRLALVSACRGGGSPPSGAWPGGCPGLVPPRAPHPAAGGGSRPAAGWSFTAGLCSLPPRTGNGGGVPPAAAPSACRPWHRSPSRYCSHDSTHGGPSRCLHTSP